jgi:NSS family neurotransmitter:Na+ symporter
VQKGLERSNIIFIPLLVILFGALVVRGLFLPGAVDGLNAFFTPNWAALAEPRVWLAAYAHIFFSLSIAFGIMITYSSYIKKRDNLTGPGLVVGFANSSFEVLAGIGVFSTLGFMAQQQGVQIADLEGIKGVLLSFVTFPAIVSQMPGGVGQLPRQVRVEPA